MHESPIDRMSTRGELDAYVVDPSQPLRVHGYDHYADLAQHYGFAELMLLSMTGNAPSPEDGRRFELALMFAAPVSVADAAVHAASLARRYGSRDAGVLTVAATGLAEQARCELEELEGLLLCFAEAQAAVPEPFQRDQNTDTRTLALRATLDRHGVSGPPRLEELNLAGAVNGLFFQCGLHRPCDFLAAWSLARLPLALAEGFAAQPGALREYPINLPRFAEEPAST